jgi:hypothetical protein
MMEMAVVKDDSKAQMPAENRKPSFSGNMLNVNPSKSQKREGKNFRGA